MKSAKSASKCFPVHSSSPPPCPTTLRVRGTVLPHPQIASHSPFSSPPSTPGSISSPSVHEFPELSNLLIHYIGSRILSSAKSVQMRTTRRTTHRSLSLLRTLYQQDLTFGLMNMQLGLSPAKLVVWMSVSGMAPMVLQPSTGTLIVPTGEYCDCSPSSVFVLIKLYYAALRRRLP